MFPCVVYHTILSQFMASPSADTAPTARGECLRTHDTRPHWRPTDWGQFSGDTQLAWPKTITCLEENNCVGYRLNAFNLLKNVFIELTQRVKPFYQLFTTGLYVFLKSLSIEILRYGLYRYYSFTEIPSAPPKKRCKHCEATAQMLYVINVPYFSNSW